MENRETFVIYKIWGSNGGEDVEVVFLACR
jgi:hypothetical protein